jgi:signal transduction histidine kinase
MSPRTGAWLAAGAVAAVAFQVVVTVASGPAPQVTWIITSSAVGASFLAAGLAAWRRWPANRLGLLFSIVGYAWLAPNVGNLPYALPFTFGDAVSSVYAASLAHLALAWPTGRLRSRFERWVVVAVYAWNTGQSVVSMLFWNPRTPGPGSCGPGCPANLLLVHGSSAIESAFDSWSVIVSITITATVLTLIIRHWKTARGWSRRSMTPLLWISFAVIALSVAQTLAGNLNLPVSDFALYEIAPLILLTGPAVFVVSTLLARSARGAVGTAIVDLEPGSSPAQLRDALALAIGDSTLQLAFRLPEGAGYADTRGQHLDLAVLAPSRAVTPLTAAAEAVLVHDEALEHEPQLVRLTASAASLALEHSRLQAEVQAQLEQVRASRARIVEAGDAERRRLERDLHDGAQQRLVTLSLALAMARDRAAQADPALGALIESATKEAREAITELRELARGIHPALLTQTGLAGAVQALAERSPVPTTITEVPRQRFPAAIEATAYFVVSEALANVAKHSRASTARVTIRTLPDGLVVTVTDDGTGGATPDGGSGLRGLSDRVAAAGGTLHIDSPPGAGTRLEADIPCP